MEGVGGERSGGGDEKKTRCKDVERQRFRGLKQFRCEIVHTPTHPAPWRSSLLSGIDISTSRKFQMPFSDGMENPSNWDLFLPECVIDGQVLSISGFHLHIVERLLCRLGLCDGQVPVLQELRVWQYLGEAWAGLCGIDVGGAGAFFFPFGFLDI